MLQQSHHIENCQSPMSNKLVPNNSTNNNSILSKNSQINLDIHKYALEQKCPRPLLECQVQKPLLEVSYPKPLMDIDFSKSIPDMKYNKNILMQNNHSESEATQCSIPPQPPPIAATNNRQNIQSMNVPPPALNPPPHPNFISNGNTFLPMPPFYPSDPHFSDPNSTNISFLSFPLFPPQTNGNGPMQMSWAAPPPPPPPPEGGSSQGPRSGVLPPPASYGRSNFRQGRR